jgi:hypothetical protein
VVNNALKGIDVFDHAEPPPIGDHISLYLVSDNAVDKLSTDFRPPDEEGYIFDIEMISNLSTTKHIHLRSHNLPEEFDWTVVSKQTMVNYGNNSIKTSSEEIQYRLIVGTSYFVENIESDYKSVPKVYNLAQNFPNPFNPNTVINYQLPVSSDVELSVYNLLGQKVATLVSGRMEAGFHQIEWDATGFATGVYFYQMKAADFTDVRKMILIQ